MDTVFVPGTPPVLLWVFVYDVGKRIQEKAWGGIIQTKGQK